MNLVTALAPTLDGGPPSSPAPHAGAPPGTSSPPGAPPFHSALAEHWARTAQAEGHQQEGSQESRHDRAGAHHSSDAGEAASLAGLALAQALAPRATDATPSTQGLSQAGEEAAETPARTLLAGAAALRRPEGQLPVDGTGEQGLTRLKPPIEVLPGGAEPLEGVPVTAPVGSLGEERMSGSPIVKPSTGAGEQSVALASGDGHGPLTGGAGAPGVRHGLGTPALTESARRGGEAGEQMGAPPLASGAPTRTRGTQPQGGRESTLLHPGEAAAAAPPAPSPTSALEATGALAQTPAAAPLEGASPAPTLASGVGMEHVIEAIHATIELAARQGMAQARIALHPSELGHISIHLSQTSEGLLARVSADSSVAAQALAHGRSELHQSLSSLGVSLLRLDIGSFAGSHTGEHEDRSGGAGTGSGSTARGDTDATADGREGDALEGLAPAAAPGAIDGGELVDVLA